MRGRIKPIGPGEPTRCEDYSRPYVFDKNMSLLLGRSPCLQDSDIDTRHPDLPTDPALRPWDESFLVAVKLAQFQGQIYDKLYSAAASRSNPSDQQQWVQDLSATMQGLRAELENVSPYMFSLYSVSKALNRSTLNTPFTQISSSYRESIGM